jgi:hypothetical protein
MADIIQLDFEETSTEPKGKPSVHVEAGVRKETADAVEQALLNSNCDLFVRGGLIVRIDYLKMKTWDEKDVEIQTVVECGDAFVTETIADVSAELMRGRSLIAIDNCNVPLKSTVLNQTLSQPMTELRILGKSELVLVRSNSITIANGNNLVIQGDLTRRTVSGRMDAEVERPELLRFDYSPLDDATVNRAELVMAVLTVLRAYHLAGRPSKEPLGGFEQWSYLIRGGLVWLGEDDPVDTMEGLRENDPQLSNLRAVMFEWAKIWKPGTSVTVHEMVKTAEDCRERTRIPLNQEWHNVVMSIAGRGSSINNRVLGDWLKANQDRITLFNNTGAEVRVRIKSGKILHGRQTRTLVKAEREYKQEALL